jgi:hypothetical protein
LKTDFKKNIHFICNEILDRKISDLNAVLNELAESANSETKSSMGDKYETTRSMLQIEQEKIGKQLSELLDQKNQLNKINPELYHESPGLGSLIETDKGSFFIATALGKINIEARDIMVISPKSPLATNMVGAVNDEFSFNGQVYRILSVS